MQVLDAGLAAAQMSPQFAAVASRKRPVQKLRQCGKGCTALLGSVDGSFHCGRTVKARGADRGSTVWRRYLSSSLRTKTRARCNLIFAVPSEIRITSATSR